MGSKNCRQNLSNPVIGPTVFGSSGAKPVFAVFGLNPYLDHSSICYEKNLAGNVLNDYAAFYNSNSLNSFFPFVLNPMSRYYRTFFVIYYSLIKRGFLVWDKFIKDCKSQDIKNKCIADKYINVIKACPIVVAELIPWHSAKTSTINIINLYKQLPVYQQYHNYLFKVLNNKLATNAIIFSHGKASSATLRQVLNGQLLFLQDFFGNPNNPTVSTHTLAIWNGRVVVIINQFLGIAPPNALKSNGQYKDLVKNIIDYSKQNGIGLPCDCNEIPFNESMFEFFE